MKRDLEWRGIPSMWRARACLFNQGDHCTYPKSIRFCPLCTRFLLSSFNDAGVRGQVEFVERLKVTRLALTVSVLSLLISLLALGVNALRLLRDSAGKAP
jgi:hypothetical protein